MKWEKDVPSWFEWTKTQLSANQVVGLDFSQYPASAVKTRIEFFKEAEITVQSVPNLVDKVWSEERPVRPTNPCKVLDIKYHGKSSLDKQEQIAAKIANESYEALLVTTLDDICWITNLRGTDIEYNPVFFSYALFYPKRAADSEEPRVVLYITESKVAEIGDYLSEQKIKVCPYEAITE